MSDPSLARTAPTKANKGQRRPTKTKKGPNDTSGVVWVLGVFFVLFFSILLTTHYVRPFFGPDSAHESQQRPIQAYEDKKGPKRCIWHCLGPRCVFCSFFLRFIDNSL